MRLGDEIFELRARAPAFSAKNPETEIRQRAGLKRSAR